MILHGDVFYDVFWSIKKHTYSSDRFNYLFLLTAYNIQTMNDECIFISQKTEYARIKKKNLSLQPKPIFFLLFSFSLPLYRQFITDISFKYLANSVLKPFIQIKLFGIFQILKYHIFPFSIKKYQLTKVLSFQVQKKNMTKNSNL